MKITTLAFFILFAFSVSAQTGYYYKYDFDQYLRTKITNPEAYLKEINGFLEYPTISRECGFELHLTYMIMNHGVDSSEVFLISKEQLSVYDEYKQEYFTDDIYSYYFRHAFKIADKKYLKKNQEKFFTTFTVLYEIEPYRFTVQFEDVDFLVQAKKMVVPKTLDAH